MDLIERTKPHMLALFRIVFGLLFAMHGAATLFGLFGKGGKVPEFGAWPSWWASAIQLIGGVLVMTGLGARIAAVVCSGSMAYAYFTVHQAKDLLPIQNGGEAAALFAWAFLLIAFFGPGSFALSALLRRTQSEGAREPSLAS